MTWPPRYPDLSLPDFFLWGLLKAQVYRTRVRSLALLKRRIRAGVRHIPLRTLRDAAAVLPLWARACASASAADTPRQSYTGDGENSPLVILFLFTRIFLFCSILLSPTTERAPVYVPHKTPMHTLHGHTREGPGETKLRF